MDVQYRLGTVKKTNEDGSIRFRLITRDVDRYSEVVEPSGAVLTNLKKNPIWLWAHNQEAWGGLVRPPIGKILTDTIDQTEEYLDMDVLFDEKGKDSFAAMIADKHRNGFLTSTSVGFMPITISSEAVKDGQKGPTHVKYEVLEGSSVPIPANPNAIQQNEWSEFMDKCKSYGFQTDGLKSWLKMAGWEEHEVKDAVIEKVQVNIPYEIKEVEEPEKKSQDFNQDIFMAEIRQRALTLETEFKAGMVLSKTNKKLVEDAIAALQKLLDSANKEDAKKEDDKKDLDKSDEILKLLTNIKTETHDDEILNSLTEIKNLL